jgi:hypothetical protein
VDDVGDDSDDEVTAARLACLRIGLGAHVH